MDIVIYIDVFFFWNFIIDYLLLSLLVWFRRQKATKVRRMLGALFGSCIALIMVVISPFNNQFYYIIGYVIIALCMILITFIKSTPKIFLKNYLFFLCCSNCFAGILMSQGIRLSWQNIINLETLNPRNTNTGNQVFLSIFYGMSYVIPILLYLWYKRKLPEKESGIFDVVVRYKEKECHGKGFLDTGNLVINPMDGKPVILLEKHFFEGMIGHGFQAKEEFFLGLDGLCIIPYRSAGNEHGIFYGVKVAEVLLFQNGEIWNRSGLVVACCENLIPEWKEYQMLIGSDVLNVLN